MDINETIKKLQEINERLLIEDQEIEEEEELLLEKNKKKNLIDNSIKNKKNLANIRRKG